MNDAHLVRHLKQALAVVRGPRGGAAGAGVALGVGGRRVLAVPVGLARGLAEGRHDLVGHDRLELLTADEEAGFGLFELPEGSTLAPLSALAAAPAPDGEPLLSTGPGLTVPTGGGHDRHLWITRSARLAGRLHVFSEGRREEEFRYLVDLPPEALPPGSPVARTADGALIGLLAESEPPGAGLSLVLPIREALTLLERLGPGPQPGGLA